MSRMRALPSPWANCMRTMRTWNGCSGMILDCSTVPFFQFSWSER